MAIRLRVHREFGKRKAPSESRDPHPFFLISIAGEGKSEELYFKGLKEHIHDLGQDGVLKIEVLEKEEEYSTMSHPVRLLDLLEERMDHWHEWEISPDELWMIVDRDPQDRSGEQLQEIFDKCSSEKFNIALTNPAFEFWLLLHVDDLRGYDKTELYENKKVSSDRRFLEEVLSDKIGGYSKGKLDFRKFADGIRDAIQRANKFENRPDRLTDSLGTNIHILIGTFIN